MTLEELINLATNRARMSGFEFDPYHPDQLGTKMLLVVAEVVEAFEHVREGKGIHEQWVDEAGKPDGFVVEVADIFIRLGHLCGEAGIGEELEIAIMTKLDANQARGHMHGGKVV